ncbi:hypothetical protein ACFRQM_13970 [Streptomyces sp. NPDC056831]|uniref:hypothetical protein n=1 Tax=Streptomyces sp. NPDC056831 TaxID=3345954 RepID=UPI0036D16F21
MDPPEHFGSWKGAHDRLRRWAADGTWERRCSPPCSLRPTLKATSTGPSRSTPRSSVPTIAPPGPVKIHWPRVRLQCAPSIGALTASAFKISAPVSHPSWSASIQWWKLLRS